MTSLQRMVLVAIGTALVWPHAPLLAQDSTMAPRMFNLGADSALASWPQLKLPDSASVPASERRAWLELARGTRLLRESRGSADRTGLDAAQAAFDEAIYRAPPNWPEPWYGLALVDFALDSIGAVVKPSMHSGAGVHYQEAAIQALGRALQADSTYGPAAELLGDVLVPFSERGLDADIQLAVRRAAVSSAVPSTWLALGRVFRSRQLPDSAIWAFGRFLALGGDSGVAMLEQARNLSVLGRDQAAVAVYLAGSDAAGRLGRALYRRDIAWVASGEELHAFDAASPDSVGAFVRTFWSKRDAEDLRAPGERLAEHLRRWRYVFTHFQLSSRLGGATSLNSANCGPGAFTSLRDDRRTPDGMDSPDLQLFSPGVYAATKRGHRVIDDRGLIYMRHGEPDQRAAFHGIRIGVVQTYPNASWKYATPNGTLLFHFCGSASLGTQAPTTLVEMLPLDFDVLSSRMGLDGRYQRLAREMSSSSGRLLVQQLVREGRGAIEIGLATDDYLPDFKHAIAPLVQFLVAGFRPGGRGDVVVVFALSGEDLAGVPLEDGQTGYRLALRLIATSAQGEVRRIDTTRSFRARRELTQEQYLFALEDLTLPAGEWTVRLAVQQHDSDAGGAVERIGVVIPPDDSLALSDLVLGREGADLRWRGPNGDVALNPLDAYPRHGGAELYYEIKGTREGSSYHTELAVRSVAEGAEGDVLLSFDEVADGSIVRSRRAIGLDQLHEGQYRMTVTVTEQETGRKASRSRLLNVRSGS